MKTAPTDRLGILLMSVTALAFAAPDGISRPHAWQDSVSMPMPSRFGFLPAFVAVLAACAMVGALVKPGLIARHGIFTSWPLMVALLSGPMLGEWVGCQRHHGDWRRDFICS